VKTANAEVVRALSDALWRERDLDAAFDLVHPEADFDWSDSRAPYHGHFKGHAELTRAFEVMMDAWDEWYPEFEEVVEIDRETVLIVTHVRARGKESGVPVEARGASIWSVRDGKVVGAKLFQSKTEALEAVGLAEKR
jgi:ketosteroid isomerase-like protein